MNTLRKKFLTAATIWVIFDTNHDTLTNCALGLGPGLLRLNSAPRLNPFGANSINQSC